MTTAPTKPSRLDSIDQCALAMAYATIALAVCIWRFAPAGPIPMHLDFWGRVNGWGDHNEAALVVGGTTGLIGFFYVFVGAMARGHAPDSPARRGLRTARVALLAIGVLIAVLMAELAFSGVRPGVDPSAQSRIWTATLSLIFLVIGALIGKASPNPFVGVRTYWALKSRLAWDKSNRLAGRLFFWIGLAGLIAAPVAPPEPETAVVISAVLLAVALSVFESWRIWRTDPDRQFP